MLMNSNILRSPAASESRLQRSFERNPKFLYLLGLYDAHPCQVTIPASLTEIVSARDLRPDFLMCSSKERLWDVVELKRAVIDDGLIVGTPARRRFGKPVQEAVAQLGTYLEVLRARE